MFTARTVARFAPRAATRMTAAARPAIARPSAILRVPQISAFSTSMLRKAASIDSDLSKKLEAEIRFETEMRDNETAPVSIEDFQNNGPWELHDIPGDEEVKLTRTYGEEKITVAFSIADINSMNEDMMDEDPALDDEGENLQQNEDGEGGSEHEPSVQCRLNIVIEKGEGKGCINIDAVAQDASIMVENLYFYKDPAMAHNTDANVNHSRMNVYGGPPFGTLDEDLQLMVEQYLDERGINSELAVFVPDYMDMKEHKEYMSWLQNFKKFVDA